MGWTLSQASRAKEVIWREESGCYVVTSHAIGAAGYPVVNGMKAHRAAWLFFHGPIADGLVVRHKCDNRLCVNLDHLELGTREENVRDAIARGRHTRGSIHGKAKINEETALAVYLEEGPYRAIAARYNVSLFQVIDIKNHRTWKHVTTRKDGP